MVASNRWTAQKWNHDETSKTVRKCPKIVRNLPNEDRLGKSKRGVTNGGLRENRGGILPGKSGLFGANWGLFRAHRGLFGADWDQLAPFRPSPHLLSPRLDFPEQILTYFGHFWPICSMFLSGDPVQRMPATRQMKTFSALIHEWGFFSHPF